MPHRFLPRLDVGLATAQERISARIAAGVQVLDLVDSASADTTQLAKLELIKWREQNLTELAAIFEDNSVATRYARDVPIISHRHMAIQRSRRELQEMLANHLTFLDGILRQLPTYAEVQERGARLELEARPVTTTGDVEASQQLDSADVLTFEFVSEPAFRSILSADHQEANLAYQHRLFKAAAILSGSVIEGMLMDTLRRHPGALATVAFTKHLKRHETLQWSKISLTELLRAAVELKLIGESAGQLAQGARDFRDTVHPDSELRSGVRARGEEAAVLLRVVALIHRDLLAAFSNGSTQ